MSESSSEKSPEELKHEIDEIRDNIGGLATELDHRRHHAFDVGSQVKRHGLSLAIGGGVLIGVVTGAVLLTQRRRRARRSLPVRAIRIGQALARLIDHPERQSPPPPSIGGKILAAAGAAAASLLVRRLVQRVVDDRPSPARRRYSLSKEWDCSSTNDGRNG